MQLPAIMDIQLNIGTQAIYAQMPFEWTSDGVLMLNYDKF